MGRKLNLSHLSEAECEHILNVVHKDFNIRYMEKERLRQIEEDVVEEETKYSILSKSQVFNEKHCICCFSRFLLLFNPRILCDFCKFCVCKRCIEIDNEKKCRCCIACIKQRQLKRQSNEWFYSSVEKKFKRCGSAKVIRSLYKRRLIGSTDADSRSLVIMMTHSDVSDSTTTTTMTHRSLHSIGCTDNDNDDVATDNARQRTRCGATLPKSITMATGDTTTEFKRSMSADGQGHLKDGRDLSDRSLEEEEEVGGVTAANQVNSQSAQRCGDDVGGRMDSCVQTDDDDLRSGMIISSSAEMGTMTMDGMDGVGGDGGGVDGSASASRSLAGFDGMSTVSTEGHETDPQFIQRPHNIRVLEAEPLIVECKVHGTEPLDVLWFCNRNQGVQQLEESDRCELRRHSNASFSLTLFEMHPTQDNLDYLCIVVNAVGQCAQGFTVAVDANAHAHMCPQFTCPSDVVEIVPEGGEAVLRCSVSAYPEPKVTWYKNNKKLTHRGRYRTDRHVPDALHYTLVIDEVKSDDSGSYVAVASNAAGQSRLSLQLLVQPNVSEMTRCDEAASSVADAAADLHSNEDDLMRLAEGVSRTQGRYTTTAARMLRSADAMSSMQCQLDEMDRTLQDLEGEVLDVISDEDDDDDDDDEANNNSNGCRQLLDDLDDMKSSAEAVGMVTSAALQLLSSAKDLARETVQHGEEEEDDEEEEEEDVEEEGDNDEEEEEEEDYEEQDDDEEECIDADDLKLSYQELEKLFEVGLISRSQLRNRLVQKRDIKHIRSFLQSTMSSALKDSMHGHAHSTADDQSESGMDTSVDSLEVRDEKKRNKNGNDEDGEERREKTEVVAAAGGGVGGVGGGMMDNQLLKKTEEQIYLTSGKVFSLEDCIRDLEKQVLQVDDETPTETLASLENSVAKAVAQVTQSDHEVNDIERQVSQWLKNSNKNVVVVVGGGKRCNRKSNNQQQQQQLKMGDEREMTRMTTMSDSETEKKRKRKRKKKMMTMTKGEEMITG